MIDRWRRPISFPIYKEPAEIEALMANSRKAGLAKSPQELTKVQKEARELVEKILDRGGEHFWATIPYCGEEYTLEWGGAKNKEGLGVESSPATAALFVQHCRTGLFPLLVQLADEYVKCCGWKSRRGFT